MKQTIKPSLVGEPILDNPLQGTMPATNADNHLLRRWTGGFVRRSPFLIRVEVDAMIKKEKEKAYATFGLDLKPSYLVEILPKLYPT